MDWRPGRSDGGEPALLLERRGQALSQAMLVVLGEDALRLVDPFGEVLASASDLPALLDALDGGVAEAPGRRVDRPVAMQLRMPVATAA